jgi:5-hydroxyisourate hydrolase
MSAITTHVLDTARGKPAAGIAVALEFLVSAAWEVLGVGVTDADGRCRSLLSEHHKLIAGQYRITFETSTYFAEQPSFYPSVSVVFLVQDPAAYYHVPLLLSPYGYSTYRGS